MAATGGSDDPVAASGTISERKRPGVAAKKVGQPLLNATFICFVLLPGPGLHGIIKNWHIQLQEM